MHTKQRGNIGEIAVAADLARKGLPVFRELGDLSKVDLLTIVRNRAIKIQVKYVSVSRNNKIVVKFSKAGPNYRFTYEADMIDLFAIFCPEVDKVFYLPFKRTLLDNHKGITLSLNGYSMNNQKVGIHRAEDQTFERALELLGPCSTD